MSKTIRNILFSFIVIHLGMITSAYAQSTSANSYFICDVEDPNFLEEGIAQGRWLMDDLKVAKTISNRESNQKISIPFYGLVEVNDRIEIITLYEEEVLGTYGPYKSSLSHPLSLTSPSTQNELNYTIALDVNSVAESTLNQLPIRPDSLRVNVEVIISDSDLKNSQITLDGTEQNVQYFDRTIEISRLVEMKIGPFLWESVEKVAPMINWDENYTLQQIIFLSDQSDWPIAMIEERNSDLKIALLNNNKIERESKTFGIPSIQAIPNPAINDIRFELENLQPGIYTIKIKNILGVLLESKSINFENQNTLAFNLSHFRKGNYFYSLEDSNGNIISTKRLIILRP